MLIVPNIGIKKLILSTNGKKIIKIIIKEIKATVSKKYLGILLKTYINFLSFQNY